MVIENPGLLLDFAAARECECCHKKVLQCDPHHIFTRGAGRIDARWNVLSLCHECHVEFHDGNVERLRFLTTVASREGTTVVDIVEAACLVRRLPKDASVEDVMAQDVPGEVKRLVVQATEDSLSGDNLVGDV